MASNFGYINTIPGRLKCVSIAFLALTLCLALLGTFTSEYFKNKDKFELIGKVNLWREFCLVASAGVCLILSILNLIIHLVNVNVYSNRRTGIIDFAYNTCAFVLVSSSGVLTVVSAVKIFDINCTEEIDCQKFNLKIAAGGISLFAALMCAVIAVVVLTNRKDAERDYLISEEK